MKKSKIFLYFFKSCRRLEENQTLQLLQPASLEIFLIKSNKNRIKLHEE